MTSSAAFTLAETLLPDTRARRYTVYPYTPDLSFEKLRLSTLGHPRGWRPVRQAYMRRELQHHANFLGSLSIWLLPSIH